MMLQLCTMATAHTMTMLCGCPCQSYTQKTGYRLVENNRLFAQRTVRPLGARTRAAKRP